MSVAISREREGKKKREEREKKEKILRGATIKKMKKRSNATTYRFIDSNKQLSMQ